MECKMKEDKLSQRGIFETPLQSLFSEIDRCFCVYTNCSKYFSLKPANGNLNTLDFPSFVV